ncbi:medium-chain fatty acid-CoA ligase faa2 [Mucor circinelloides]
MVRITLLHTLKNLLILYVDDIGKRVPAVYQGLRSIAELVPQSGDENSFVGIYARNSLHTILTEIACHRNGLVTVPVSASAPTTHLAHVIEKTAVKVLLTDVALLGQVLSFAKGSSLKKLVVFGQASAKDKQQAQDIGIELLSFEELETKGKTANFEAVAVAPNDIASIYFTSQNDSKNGVVLTQKNLLSSVSSYLLVVPPQQRVTPKDRLMLNLPIDNVFGHVLVAAVSLLGGSIAFGEEIDGEQGIDVTASLAHIAEAKPTIFASGPAFLHQVKQLIESRYGKSFLFKRGFSIKEGYLKESRLVDDCKYDMLVFRDIRKTLFGGNLRLVYIDNDDNADPALAIFLRAVLSVQVLQAFNTTETTSSITASMFYDYNAIPEAKGAPLPCNEVKLIDVPELSLHAEDSPNPRGEIWVRGNNVFGGYYNDEAATSEVLDADGWYATGYLGEALANGTFKVIGKK